VSSFHDPPQSMTPNLIPMKKLAEIYTVLHYRFEIENRYSLEREKKQNIMKTQTPLTNL
jgi:hypothetical protein